MADLHSILQEYAKKRERALLLADECREAAYEKLPELRRIAHERRALAYGLGIRMREAADASAERARTEKAMRALDLEQARLLADNGLPEDYLKPHFACERCHDTGYVGGRMCACLARRLRGANYERSGLDPNERFDSFRNDIYPDERQKRGSLKAMELCSKYASGLSYNGASGLMLLGKPGLGKSFLLNCIGNAAFDGGADVVKLSSYTIIERKLGSLGGGSLLPELVSPALLIIDDLGTEPNVPNITIETFFALINEREKAKKPTVIGAALTPENILEFYGENIFTRVTSPVFFTVLTLEGSDLRRSIKPGSR